MSALTELKENLESAKTARFVTTVLRDISATKLQPIRAEFDRNKAFYEEMHELDELVQKYAALQRAIAEEKPVKKGKQILVALTSNKRFYGTLNRDIIESLIERLGSDTESSCLVIGQTGRQFLKHSEHAERCEYTEFVGDEPTAQEAFKLVEHLADYGRVLMFHPKFVTAFTQEPGVTDLTHKPEQEPAKEIDIDYIFEPDITQLRDFFETQVRLILFNRVILETRLAQTGARLAKMQRAREQAGEAVEAQRHTIHKEEMTLRNLRLLETFAGFQTKELV